MDVNVKALLDYLNIPAIGAYIITPTTFYLVDGSWLISPKDYGVKITTTTTSTNIHDLKAYALLMRIIADPHHITHYMEQVIESLIKRVANCSMSKFVLVYDKDESCIEVIGSRVQHMDVNGENGRMDSKCVWRIDTKMKTVHRHTPNQWMLESSTWNVEDYYQDIAGCRILLNDINKRVT